MYKQDTLLTQELVKSDTQNSGIKRMLSLISFQLNLSNDTLSLRWHTLISFGSVSLKFLKDYEEEHVRFLPGSNLPDSPYTPPLDYKEKLEQSKDGTFTRFYDKFFKLIVDAFLIVTKDKSLNQKVERTGR